jgi:tRNA(Ile)-lysidine synthase
VKSVRVKGRAIARVVEPVAAALERVRLAPGSVILVAVSGGPDSVALLHALDSLRLHLHFDLVAAHLNHRLRGEEADRDERFVRDLCARLGIDLIVERLRGLKPSSRNMEERARELRHRFLNRAADRAAASHIALAHHADDQAETVLMRLMRGAGAAGLGAMAESGPGRRLRPLLTVNRAAISAYLDAIGATCITDSSNESPSIFRNRIRLKLLPTLERDYAPGLARRLTEVAEEMRSLDDYLTHAAREELEGRGGDGRLSITGFASLHPALGNALLREFLRDWFGDLRRVSRDHIEALRQLCTGTNPSGRVILPGGRQVRRDYNFALLENQAAARSAKPFLVKLQQQGTTRVECAGCSLAARLSEGSDGTLPQPPLGATEALIDVDRINADLMVRSFRAGDRFEPHGMRGSRKLQDIFVDHKLPRNLRSVWPLVVTEDRILWIPGIARSRIALVTPATKKVLYLQASLLPRDRLTSLLKKQATC